MISILAFYPLASAVPVETYSSIQWNQPLVPVGAGTVLNPASQNIFIMGQYRTCGAFVQQK